VRICAKNNPGYYARTTQEFYYFFYEGLGFPGREVEADFPFGRIFFRSAEVVPIGFVRRRC
jgi:hypothetical protein